MLSNAGTNIEAIQHLVRASMLAGAGDADNFVGRPATRSRGASDIIMIAFGWWVLSSIHLEDPAWTNVLLVVLICNVIALGAAISREKGSP